MSDGGPEAGGPEAGDPEAGRSTPPPVAAPRPRARCKPWTAALVLLSPVLVLSVADAAVLLRAVIDPRSTCWLKPFKDAGEKYLYPFEIHLLYFGATLSFWGPVVLLLAAMFWYIGWIRLGELAVVAVVAAVLLYLTGVDYAWMVHLYAGRYQAACG